MEYFRSDNKFIYLNDDYLEVYIPLIFFDESKRYASDFSSYIETLGLVNVGIFENGKRKEFKIFKHPYQIKLYSYDNVTETVDLPGEGPTPCRVLSYNKDSIVMDNAIVQDAQNALTYLDMVMDGKIPKSIPYDKASELWGINQAMNGVGFGVRQEVQEMVLSLNYRNPNNLSETFASLYGRDESISPYNYETVGSRQICQYASTFSSLTFEDMDSMITTSINRSRHKGKESYSPVEDVIKM